MEKLKSSKVIALLSTGLFVATLVWLLNLRTVNGSLESGLERERLKSEQLLSEKLELEKDLQKFKGQLSTLRESNYDLGNFVKSLQGKLASQESDYNRMKKENLSLAQIKKQKQELAALQNQLENELTLLKSTNESLESKNAELTSAVAQLEERNRALTDDLNRAMYASLDQSQIQAVKGKAEKLTVRAKRTKKLIANFQVPSHLKNLSYRIVNSAGEVLKETDGAIASTITPIQESFVASSDSDSQGKGLQRVQMTFLPNKRLNSGTYTVEILNDNLYVSSLKVKLR